MYIIIQAPTFVCKMSNECKAMSTHRSSLIGRRVSLLLLLYMYREKWRGQMVCDICGQEGADICKVTETYGKGKDLLVIENIPMVRCFHCGESYFTAETLHEIERIKLHCKSSSTKRPVKVANFA